MAVVAAFVLGPEGFGRMMHDGVDPATQNDIVWHESLGLLVLALTAMRLIWMAFRPAAPQFSMTPWMHWTAKAVQVALWVLLLALPASAILTLASEGHPLTLLGGLRVEQMPWIANSPVASLADWGEVHQFLGDAIVWLAGLHALAAIYHHVVLKDGVLRSILPFR